MPRSLAIPDEVQQAIRARLAEALEHAAGAFESAAEDEDTLTGDLCGALRTSRRRVFVAQSVAEIPGEWTWSINYYKFRGRGAGAAESHLGADGLFELTVDYGGHTETKSLLFQAKVEGKQPGALLQQALKLSTWREAAFVLLHSPNGFFAVNIDDAVANQGRVGTSSRVPLDEFLGRTYVGCLIGDLDLHWDRKRKLLTWRAMNGEIVGVRFSPRHRVRIAIAAPKRGRRIEGIDRIVGPNELPQFRMQAVPEDILGLDRAATPAQAKQAHKRLALTYHPDKFPDLADEIRAFAKRRMQEANVARQKWGKA